MVTDQQVLLMRRKIVEGKSNRIRFQEWRLASTVEVKSGRTTVQPMWHMSGQSPVAPHVLRFPCEQRMATDSPLQFHVVCEQFGPDFTRIQQSVQKTPF